MILESNPIVALWCSYCAGDEAEYKIEAIIDGVEMQLMACEQCYQKIPFDDNNDYGDGES